MTLPRRLPGRVTSLLPALLVFLPLAASAQQRPVPKPPPPPDPLVRMNESIDALTKKVWPSVVQILVSSYGPRDRRWRRARRASSSAGSDRPARAS